MGFRTVLDRSDFYFLGGKLFIGFDRLFPLSIICVSCLAGDPAMAGQCFSVCNDQHSRRSVARSMSPLRYAF